MTGFAPAPRRQTREIEVIDPPQQRREVEEFLGDQVYDTALALDAAAADHQTSP